MFSALNQGSSIYILDKVDSKLKIGTITSISVPRNNYNPSLNIQNNQVIDIKCTVEGMNQEYTNIPSTYSLISYNNGQLILSESKQGLQQEVENVLNSSREIINNIDKYQRQIISYEAILKQLNPQFAKDKERDERLDSLESRFEGVSNKLDRILNLVTNKN